MNTTQTLESITISPLCTITVKYHGPTNHSGSRYVATDGTRRYTHNYDYAFNYTKNAALAALGFVQKYDLEWTIDAIHELPDGSYVATLK